MADQASPPSGQAERGAIEPPENFAFVMNVARLTDSATYLLAPGHLLRRATPEEITAIKGGMEHIPGVHARHLWEYELGTGVLRRLPESEWRYFVIAFQGTNATICDLKEAFALLPVEIEIGLTVVHQDWDTPGRFVPSRIWSPAYEFHVLEAARLNASFFVDLSSAEVAEISTIHSQLRQTDSSLIDVKRLVRQLIQLKELPHQSPLRFLGYFALLESVLTHAPKPTDPYDSITRQVKKKLTLLNRRLAAPIDYGPFSGTPAETVWSKMYSYRSIIAHGGMPEFTGDLAILGNQGNALKLVKETVKKIVRQAMIEPQLLVDLREC
jgi:hypothetical protein